MKRSVKLFIVLLAASLDLTFAEMSSTHVPWNLDGANERIDQYRKGDLTVRFKLADGSMLSGEFPVNFELAKHKFHFGTSVTQNYGIYQLENFESCRQRVADLFNYITLGFYYGSVHRVQDDISVPEVTLDDYEWGIAHDMTLRGHPLFWHNSIPNWMRNETDLEAFESSIKYHIRYVIKTFPEITEWDVYNEAVAAFYNHVEQTAVQDWIRTKGEIRDAVKYLFEYSMQVNPEKKYINNHYTYEHQDFKDLNQFLLDEGVDLGAVGIQTHMHQEDSFLTENEMWNMLEEYSVYGKIQLSEVTVPSSVPFSDWQEVQAFEEAIKDARANGEETPFRPSVPEWETFQASYLSDFYTLAFSHPAVEAIVYWNTTDLNAWRGAAAGLVDREHNPKPAYNELFRLIKEEWHTSVDSQTQSNGTLSFNGFYGEYEGSVTIQDVDYYFTFSHDGDHSTVTVDLTEDPTVEQIRENLIRNPGFEQDLYWWSRSTNNGSVAKYSVVREASPEGSKHLECEVEQTGPNPWDIQMRSNIFPVDQSHLYRLTFRAKSDLQGASLSIFNNVKQGYYQGTSFDLTNTWDNYTFEFTPNEDSKQIKFNFLEVTDYYLDDVVVEDLNAEIFYTLSVGNGIGDGNYTESSVVNISAGPVTESTFQYWTGDISYINDPYASQTSLLMPDDDVNIAAVFLDASPYNIWTTGPWMNGELVDSSPLLDFDGGGQTNGLEWIIGGDPTLSADDSNLVPIVSRGLNQNGKLLFDYRLNDQVLKDPDWLVAFVYSPDIDGGSWVPAIHEGFGENDVTITVEEDGYGNGINKVTVALPSNKAEEGRLFVRLQNIVESQSY